MNPTFLKRLGALRELGTSHQWAEDIAAGAFLLVAIIILCLSVL